METKKQCVVHQTIVRLTAEIERIRQAQRLIAKADRALRAGRDDVLRTMGFGSEHIEELKRSAVISKVSAFPRFTKRNNAATVCYLRKEVATLRRHLSNCNAREGERKTKSCTGTNVDDT